MPAFSNPTAYETWMGRWSERLAPLFLDFADAGKSGRYLDVGSGTGVLARHILQRFEGAEVVGLEPSPDYVEYARETIASQRASFQTGDALALPFTDGEFDATLALLVLQEIPDAEKAVREMRRVTARGGCVSATQWDFVSGMPSLSTFWEAVGEVVPREQARKEARGRLAQGYSGLDALARLWTGAGLADVETAALDITMEFVSFEDYWKPFLSGATPTSSYAATLSQEQRDAIASKLQARVLGNGPDRAFSLPARAVAVRGRVP